MTELRFSVISDDAESIAEIAQLAKGFQGASQTTMSVTRYPGIAQGKRC